MDDLLPCTSPVEEAEKDLYFSITFCVRTLEEDLLCCMNVR